MGLEVGKTKFVYRTCSVCFTGIYMCILCFWDQGLTFAEASHFRTKSFNPALEKDEKVRSSLYEAGS